MTSPSRRVAVAVAGSSAMMLAALFLLKSAALSQPAPATPFMERSRKMSAEAEAKGLAEPFKGITTNGQVRTGLFPIRSTGVSTEPVRQAADAFLASLTPEQRQKTVFGIER
jgi:hypothetical protein